MYHKRSLIFAPATRFHEFRDLYPSREFAPRIAPVFQELVSEGVVRILPALLNLAGPVQEAIGEFIAARQLTSHPIAVSHWNREQDEWYSTPDGGRRHRGVTCLKGSPRFNSTINLNFQ